MLVVCDGMNFTALASAQDHKGSLTAIWVLILEADELILRPIVTQICISANK